MNTLFLIPARGGSKGIPDKNIKPLNGIPLIDYSIRVARQFTDDKNICVSTDSDTIIETVNKLGLEVPFIRPSHLATDEASTYDVILHALEYYQGKGIHYDRLVLLQPTSPLRTQQDVQQCLELYSEGLDMVVSVEEIPDPSYLCYSENKEGFLTKISEGKYTRRQDVPMVYKYNGAVYVMNVNSLKEKTIATFTKVKKFVMSDIRSVDIDSSLDWEIAEIILRKKFHS